MINENLNQIQKWKSRSQFPPLLKLNYQFDIKRLLSDYLDLDQKKKWDGLSKEYVGLCETHSQLPPFFLDAEACSYGDMQAYQQLALSEFDPQFSLNMRTERSSTFWDHKSPHDNPRADERFYRKEVSEIPSYTKEVLDFFRPFLHRVRFAKLMPGKEVRPHIDYDTKYSCRIHIPILTNPSCLMGVEYKGKVIETHFPADGSCYFINQGYKHWATNPSASPRIHLILSVDSQKFLDDAREIN